MKACIYHNPRCSKSRQTLALLQEKGMEIEEVRYLEHPPDAKTLKEIIKKLGCDVKDIMRKKEAKDAGINDLDGDALVEAMVKNPAVIQRPIVVSGAKAVVGRPPENVLDII